VADVLALGRLSIRVVVRVVVGARQGGGGVRGDEAVASVLHVASVDGVGVAAQRGRAFGKGQAIGPQGHLADRPRGHRLHHLGHLQRGTGALVRQCGLCMAGSCALPAAHMQQTHALHSTKTGLDSCSIRTRVRNVARTNKLDKQKYECKL